MSIFSNIIGAIPQNPVVNPQANFGGGSQLIDVAPIPDMSGYTAGEVASSIAHSVQHEAEHTAQILHNAGGTSASVVTTLHPVTNTMFKGGQGVPSIIVNIPPNPNPADLLSSMFWGVQTKDEQETRRKEGIYTAFDKALGGVLPGGSPFDWAPLKNTAMWIGVLGLGAVAIYALLKRG